MMSIARRMAMVAPSWCQRTPSGPEDNRTQRAMARMLTELRDLKQSVTLLERELLDNQRRFDAEHETLIWSHPGMSTYYRNRHGRVFTVLPWRLADYWRFAHDANLGDYRCSGQAADSA